MVDYFFLFNFVEILSIMGKEKLTAEGINLKQIYINPFSFQYGYHHYEPKVYSMDTYFEGFNLRQLNRITYIFNQFALAYQSYMFLLENKKRREVRISKNETIALEYFDKIYSNVLVVNSFMRKFQNSSEVKYHSHKNTFGEQYDKDYHGRCWIKSVQELKNQKYVRFTTKLGKKWGYGPTEEYFPKDKVHINGLNQNLGTFYRWGYWLEYFKVASSENFFSNDELNKFNPNIMNEIFDDALNLMKVLNKLRYVNTFEMFDEKLLN